MFRPRGKINRRILVALIVVFPLLCSPAQAISSDVPLTQQARSALRRATEFLRSLSTQGGYLWWYSEDLRERFGENKATLTQIWVQPPGTPSVGMAFLRAYEVTKDPYYLEAAQAAAQALVRGQLQSGGWDYLIDFDPGESPKWYRRTDAEKASLPKKELAGRKNGSTFDDDNTQSAIRFLLAYLSMVKEVNKTSSQQQTAHREIQAALDYGLAKMLEAQYPNGAWPQRYEGKPHDPAKFPVMAATMPSQYSREHSK